MSNLSPFSWHPSLTYSVLAVMFPRNNQDCYKNRCLQAGSPYTSFPGACLNGCQWRAGRTNAQCSKFCQDSYITKQDVLHTQNDAPYYQEQLVISCRFGCDKRCNGVQEKKAVGCLAMFSGGIKGDCEAQSLRRLR